MPAKVNSLVHTDLLHRCRAEGEDGFLGAVFDTYSEHPSWAVRYLAVDGTGLENRRKVLLAPEAVAKVDARRKRIKFALSKKRVEASPRIESQLPVNRQFEMELRRYYRWIPYWKEIGAPIPPELSVKEAPPPAAASESDLTTALRSAAAFEDAGIATSSGVIGTLAGFFVDVKAWRMRYMDIAAANDVSSDHILAPLQIIESVSWPDKMLTLTVDKNFLMSAPKYHPGAALTLDDKKKIHTHFGRHLYPKN